MMLKALEIVGFKSFADKTRFDFPSGITVIVGPNGSGKSNIVDAIKWVLGEQSVKSLRGKEMADVIFNGSGARRAMNSAEITLTFDNADGRLALETPQVHITRRVYRSGEGEYLINRQPSRLRDIRDLLAGTGLGTQAYSVIEQGKVDVLLQSSPRERRMIFEEAAGISRFKAKKVEALRRLERVQQNLLRLSDIVDEVDNRLRAVRAQAGKARRYKEYSDRLQELRTQVALVDWTRLTERLGGFEAELNELSNQGETATAEIEVLEAGLLEADTRIGEVNEMIRQAGAQIAANRERIASAESTIEHERTRSTDLEQEIVRHRRQVAQLNVRAGDLQQQLQETVASVEAAEAEHREITRHLAEGERRLSDLIVRLDQIRGESQQRRAAYMEQMREVAATGNQISRLESQVAAASAAQARDRKRLDELEQQLAALAGQLEQLHDEQQRLTEEADHRAEKLSAAQMRLAGHREQLASHETQMSQLYRRQGALAERISVLQELEKRYEGVSPGVKEVLSLARAQATSPFQSVRGLVADLLEVSVEAAPLVEVALGEATQHVVVPRSREMLEYVASQSSQLSGRVGFVWLEAANPSETSEPDLQKKAGVLGRADRFVETAAEYQPLAYRLLGRTWFVDTLGRALALAESEEDAGLQYVTLAGELVAVDGSVTVGPRHAAGGIISRRSELRELTAQLGEVEEKLGEKQQAIERLQEQIGEDETRVGQCAADHQKMLETLGEHRHRITAADERRSQHVQQRESLQTELSAVTAQHDEACRELDEARTRHAEMECELAEMESQQSVLVEQIAQLEADWQTRNQDTTGVKVELAKSDERLRNLRSRMKQYEESRQERHRAIAEGREELELCIRRAEQSRWSILRAESEVAELYLRKEAFALETVDLINQREAVQEQRTQRTSEVQRIRSRLRKIEEKIHAKQLTANEVSHERTTLADRLREDYGIELSELEHDPTAEGQQQREAVQEEIDELRRKINHLGNVNLEALEELEQLEGRFNTLSGQYQDLTSAKATLERIIDKINSDSRQLFAETLQTVKGHFQSLFRSLFGGGQADIVLEEGVDILESGIEIVARPPGKEPRSISLLSGGEKTLTCVALLLAIFRSRPSPFCVLDEVDAALDEANIDRFTKVLQEFLAWTQFIIVTHSKKTMTCANTIYGVTMQESGVSKQVSVRFEDVSDNGEIRVAADRYSSDAAADEDETQAA